MIWLYHLWAACPCLSWSTVVFRRSIGVEFVTEREIALARVQISNPSHLFVQFKYSVYGHKLHTYTRILHAVPLAWGLLRLAPIMPSPPRLEGFHCPVRILFHIYRKIWLHSPLDIFCFSLLKRFESLVNDRDSLFVFIAFASFSSKSLSLTLHPTGAIDPNRPGRCANN